MSLSSLAVVLNALRLSRSAAAVERKTTEAGRQLAPARV
jgi:hypothetical protein